MHALCDKQIKVLEIVVIAIFIYDYMIDLYILTLILSGIYQLLI